jgi:uncharacterized glyoxalase superfamily protein PhnB
VPDPLDALRLPATPVAPDPAFTRALRARLEAALAPEIRLREEEPVPPTDALTPYLSVGDAAAALAWYVDVLGAVETLRFTGDDGRVGHAELTVAGSRLMLADEYPEVGVHAPPHYGGTPVTLHLEVADVDGTHERAVAAGATSERAPSDQGHGNRNALVQDPWGHRWMLSQPIDAARTAAAQDDPDTAIVGFTVTGGRAPVEPGYLVLHTGDLDRARAFFGALFAWEVHDGSIEGGGHVANTRFPMGLAPPADDGRPATILFRVDDADAEARRVEELGGRVLHRAEHPSGITTECVDDQGLRFDLYQAAPGY